MADLWAGLISAIPNAIGQVGGLIQGQQALNDNRAINQKNFALQEQANRDNLAFQQQNLDYIKHRDQLTMEREDNSIQRQAADMEAAGLSKTLAAGGGAAASGPINTNPIKSEAPQMKGNLEGQMQMAQMLNSIGKSSAETELMRANVKEIEEDIKRKKMERLTDTSDEGTSKKMAAQLAETVQRTLESEQRERNLYTQNQIDKLEEAIRTKINLPRGIDPFSTVGMQMMMESKYLSKGQKTQIMTETEGTKVVDLLSKFFHIGR